MKKNIKTAIVLLGVITTITLFSCSTSVLEEPIDDVSAYRILQDETTLISAQNVMFINTLTGWAVGSAGKIIKTTNGGTDWEEQNSGVTTVLYDIEFINENIGWAVGQTGVILKSVDGGATWTPQASGLTDTALPIIYSVDFRDENNGVAVTTLSRILTTTDGGTTWKTTTPLKRRITLRRARFVDDNTIYAIGGSGVMLKSVDRGVSYDTTAVITNGVVSAAGVPATQTMTNLQFVSKNVGYTSGGSGWVARIDVASNTATLVNPPVAESMGGLFFTSETTGTVAGSFGLVFKTTDSGATWRRIKSNTSVTLTGISAPDKEIEFIVGSKVILKSK